MRAHALALAGAAGIATLAGPPALANDATFFTEQHRSYFERDAQPAAADPAETVAPATRPPRRRGAAPVVASVAAEPVEAEPDARPAFGHGHMVPDADQQFEHHPLASAIPREIVAYSGPQAPGTVVVSTQEKRLYYVMPDGQALRYGVGVGRPGFEWSGGQTVTAKREWPDWTPPPAMIKRRPDLPRHMAGGIDNPLGARAMYLGRSEYRIHGSNEPDTIGQAVSSGCIRMTNEDVADLYEHVKVGTRVIVEP